MATTLQQLEQLTVSGTKDDLISYLVGSRLVHKGQSNGFNYFRLLQTETKTQLRQRLAVEIGNRRNLEDKQ